MEIICRGYLYRDEIGSPLKGEVNYSDIFSFLIKEVGTKVTNYASDLFYDLKTIHEAITKDNPKSENFLIGLRESGVDGKACIEMRKERPDIYGCPYINIYSVDIKVDKENRDFCVVLSTVE